MRLRAPVAADSAALVAFFERLSSQSRYLRFHGARKVTPSVVAPFLDPEWAERQVLTALWAQSTPLTLRQLHKETGVPDAELQGIVTRLCMCGAARRLNTVIESFSASRRTAWLG